MLWWTKYQLHSSRWDVRLAAVRKLAQTGDAKVIESLIPELDDQHPDVRKAAVEALSRFDRPELRTRLASKLSDGETQVCEAAARALDAFGWKPEDMKLWWRKHRLQSDNPSERQAAVCELAQTRADNTIELLVPVLDDQHPDVRKAAVEALAKFDRPEVRTGLASKLFDEETQVCEAAADALDAFGWKPEDMEKRVRFASVRKNWQELVGYEDQGIKALLKAAGQVNDSDSARAAHDLLVSLGGDVVDPLLHVLDADLKAGLGEPRLGFAVTVAGVEILGALRDARALNLLGEELKHFARSWIVATDEFAPDDQQAINALYQKAFWETVCALMSCGESGVATLVDAAKSAEDEIQSLYLKLHMDDVIFIGACPSLSGRREWEFERLRRELEAMVCAPLAASQLKIGPTTREDQLAISALAAMKEFVKVSYKDQRVLKIISLFAGVPVTEDMIR